MDDIIRKRKRMEKRSNIFIALAVIFLILGIGGLCVVCGMYWATQLAETQYGIVFDAGSSHTSMYLYQWESEKVNGTGKVSQLDSCDVDGGGLSDYVSKPSDAGASLKECLKNASDSMSWASKRVTPVYLGATAGMRLIRLKDMDTASKIIDSVRDVVSDSGFDMFDAKEQIKILSGKDEGVGLWVTANYVAGTLGIILFPKWTPVLPEGASRTLGVLDLGGASTQVSFALTDKIVAPTDDIEKLTLFSQELTLYSDSFLCFGAKEMRNQVLAMLAQSFSYEGTVNHPCFAVGYESNMTYDEVFTSVCTKPYSSSTPKETLMTIIGTGDNTECTSVMAELFRTSPHFNRTVAPLPDRLLARGAYAYTVNDLKAVNSTHQVEHSTFVEKMNEFCLQNYSKLGSLGLYDPTAVCINAHYILYLISNIYKVPDDKWPGIWFTNKIGSIDMGWTLGYMTNMTSALPHSRLLLYNIDTSVFIAVLVITIILILLGIIAVVLACKYRRAQYHSLQQQHTS